MKFKVKIPVVEHTCGKGLGGKFYDEDSIHALLSMLEKHGIPFELIANIEVTSTSGTVLAKHPQLPITIGDK